MKKRKLKTKLKYKNKFFYKIYMWYIDNIKYRKKITYWDWKKEHYKE